MDNNLEPVRKKVLAQIISYMLTGITGGIGVVCWFALRELQRLIVVFGGVSVWAWRAIDLFTFIVLGISWLCLVYLSQSYFEKGYWKKSLFKRVILVNGVQTFLILVAYTLAFFIRQRYGL